MEHEAINADLFIASNTNSIDQILLTTKSTECRHKPAVAIATLPHIAGRRTLLEEDRVLEDLLYQVNS